MNTKLKNILIAGGTGLIGKRLSLYLESKNYNVCHLSRKKGKPGKTFLWDPEKGQIDKEAITNADIIINLAGAGIAEKRWTKDRKKLIINSRISSTNLLYESLATLPNKVQLFINASAIGFYGDAGDKIVNETSPASNDFLGKTCKQWEEAALQVKKLNIRTVVFRFGLVLATEGGILQEMMKPLKFGIAPVFGDGSFYQSWIHIDDLVKMMEKAIEDENISGIYNAVAPLPVTNKQFMMQLGKAMNKKFLPIKIPGGLMKLALGEMAEIVITGSNVSPGKIMSTGFNFTYSRVEDAFRDLVR